MDSQLQKLQGDYAHAMQRIRRDNGHTQREDREAIEDYVQALEQELAQRPTKTKPAFVTNPHQ